MFLFFFFRQEKLLGELSEKDSHIADLEMDRNSTGASTRAMTIEKLNNEKQQLYNQLKELVRNFLFEGKKTKTFFVFRLFLDGNSNENHSGSSNSKRRIRTTRKIFDITSSKKQLIGVCCDICQKSSMFDVVQCV